MDQHEINDTVKSVVEHHLESMYKEFDRLHRRGIDDSQVETALKHMGHHGLAEDYIAWQNDGEPVEPEEVEEEDGAPYGAHLVTDPVNSPSYKPLEEQLKGLAAIREAHAREFPQGGPDGKLA